LHEDKRLIIINGSIYRTVRCRGNR